GRQARATRSGAASLRYRRAVLRAADLLPLGGAHYRHGRLSRDPAARLGILPQCKGQDGGAERRDRSRRLDRTGRNRGRSRRKGLAAALAPDRRATAPVAARDPAQLSRTIPGSAGQKFPEPSWVNE